MKNNFIPSFPFHKKQLENTTKNLPFFLNKHGQCSTENTEKKISVDDDGCCPQGDLFFTGKQIQTTQEQSINSDQISSCKSSQITTKPSKIQQKLVREQRIISPHKYEHLSPFNSRQPVSPNIKESRLGQTPFVPIRATLKNLIQSKASPNNKNQQNFIAQGNHSNRDIKLTTSIRGNKTFTEMFQSPIKSIEKQNQILREENQLLRRQLSQIKKNLMFGGSTKKDDMISNLRNTIKKEDSELKELRLKLDIFTKKNAALTTLIENKDEQIAFLSNKLIEVEQELKEQKEKNAERLEKLKERINFMLKSYGELETKWNKAEMDWLSFKEKWMEEKGIYIHRISFLEDYIANS